MTTKHAPGPWKVVFPSGGDGGGCCIVEQGETPRRGIAYVQRLPGDHYDIERNANARLIEAAPDMLLALQTALRHAREAMPADERKQFDEGKQGPEWMFMVKKTIAKVEG